MAASSVIDFCRVSFAFSGEASLFTGVTLTIREGGFYLVQGPSGAGKSTFLRLINRLEEPSAGEILFKDRPLSFISAPGAQALLWSRASITSAADEHRVKMTLRTYAPFIGLPDMLLPWRLRGS